MTTAPSSTRKRVAIVDDDAAIRESLTIALEFQDFEVVAFEDGQAAWSACESAASLPAQVWVLDVMMPRLDGLELCRRLRGLSQTAQILFLTARDEELDKVSGLSAGADDYLGKPFSALELIARVGVLSRRAGLFQSTTKEASAPGMEGAGESPVVAGPLRLDFQRHEATWSGRPIKLSLTQFRIVGCLAQRPGFVQSRARLVEAGYPHDHYKSEKTIDTHIKRIRQALHAVDPEVDPVEAVPGVGYRWRCDDPGRLRSDDPGREGDAEIES